VRDPVHGVAFGEDRDRAPEPDPAVDPADRIAGVSNDDEDADGGEHQADQR
jgi:hypothetical protein